MDFGHKIKNLWYLDNNVIFLNNGSFGAAPKAVINEKNRISELIEHQPVSFYLDYYHPKINETRNLLCNFINSKTHNLVMTDNATTGVNTVLFSLMNELRPGAELMTTNHVYPAIRNAMKHICLIKSLNYREIEIPFENVNNQIILDIVHKNLSEKTAIAIFDHVASSTGIIFPVKQLSELCRNNGTIAIIDGAHAPGMLKLDLQDINADFYTGNCHKWLFAPKGCAFLWVNDNFLDKIHPLTISLYYNTNIQAEFDWLGTREPSSWLALNAALEFYNSFGADNIYNYNHNLVVHASNLICSEFGWSRATGDDMIGFMSSFELPGYENANFETMKILRNLFLKNFNIELPFFTFGNRLLFRISAQVYNEFHDFDILIASLKKFLK